MPDTNVSTPDAISKMCQTIMQVEQIATQAGLFLEIGIPGAVFADVARNLGCGLTGDRRFQGDSPKATYHNATLVPTHGAPRYHRWVK